MHARTFVFCSRFAAVLLLLVSVSACNSPTAPAASTIVLAVEPAALPATGGSVTVAATVTDSGGAPIQNVNVTFATTAGTLSAATAPTDSQGIARVALTSSTPATITARADNIEARLDVTVDVQMALTVTPEAPRRGEVVTASVQATSGGQPVSGNLVVDFGDGTIREMGEVSGTATTTHFYGREGTFTVSATFTRPGTQITRTTDLDIRGFAPGADQIDPRLITWLSPATTNISDWPVTSVVNGISVNPPTICIDHTMAGRWPLVSIDSNPPNIEGNILIVVNIGGQWYGGGFDWMGEGRICKSVDPDEYGRDQIRVPPLDASWHGPRSGEEVGLLISTPSSNRVPVRSVNQRTNIVLVRWP